MTTLRFEAFGRHFEISLEPHERLVTNLRSTQSLPGDLSAFRGKLEGVPGSWARFSKLEGSMVGVVWDGSELFLVDHAAKVRDLISGSPADDALLVFRASDVQLRTNDMTHHQVTGKSVRGDQLIAETAHILQGWAASANLPSRGIPLGLILDAEYPNLGNEGHALFPTNIADGILSNQANLHLDVEHIERFDYTNDPFFSNDATVLLSQLSGIKSSTPALAPLGLAHFLTYRDLDGDVRGIAQFKSLCGTEAGIGLTEVRGSTLDGLIMAHEIAHNFGAPHDGEAGSACQNTPTTFLMSATINGSPEFSACSLAEMAPVLDGASCLTTVAEGDLSLVAEPAPTIALLQQPIVLRYFVNNLGSETSFDGLLELQADSGFQFENFTVDAHDCGPQTENSWRSCSLDTMYGGESDRVDITIRPIAVGPASLRTTVSSANDSNPDNNEVILSLDVQAATDVFPRSTVHSPNLRPGETSPITAHIYNDGAFDTDALLTIRTSQLNSVSTSENCAVVSFRWLECELGNIPAGSSVDIDFEFTVAGDPLLPITSSSQSVDLIVTPTLADPIPRNNTASPSVKIWGAFIDLAAEVKSIPASILTGESGELVFEFMNNGPDTAPDARLILSSFPQLAAESVSTSRGRCDLVSSGALCYWDDVLAGERIEVRFRFKTLASGTYNLTMDVRHNSAFDTDSDNNGANAQVVISSPPSPPTQPPPSQSSGGGGAATFLIPFLMLHILARRTFRRILRFPNSGRNHVTYRDVIRSYG